MASHDNNSVNRGFYQADNESVASDRINANLESVLGYDADALLEEVEKAEDEAVLDDIYDKLMSEIQEKAEILKHAQKKNNEINSVLNSNKYLVSELEQLHIQEQQKTDGIREMIEAKRSELEQLHSQQVQHLVQFENDVRTLSVKVISAPQEFASSTLMDSVTELQRELQDRVTELVNYKQELRAAEHKLKSQPDDSFMGTSLKTFEDSINDINTLNEKMTESVEQLTNKVNSLRFEIGAINLKK